MTTATGETFRIPQANLDDLCAKLDKLARRARRLASGAITYSVGERHEERYTDAHGRERVAVSYDVTVSGPAPVVNGWSFVATLEHSPEGNIVRGVPGMTTDGELTRYRDVSAYCDHCKTNRARIDTFVLRSEDGTQYKQIGRNCLRDFLGHHDPAALAALAEYLAEARAIAGGYGGGSGEDALATDEYLRWVCAVVRRVGFVPRSKAAEWHRPATADVVTGVLADNKEHGCWADGATCGRPARAWRGKSCDWAEKGGHIGVTDADAAQADAALTWIRAQEIDERTSDYLYNLYTACKSDAVEARRYGIVASLVAAYNRAQEREADRAEKAARQAEKVNEWVGEVGKRQVLTLTVKRTSHIDGHYGISTLHVFEDSDGRAFKWFASSAELAEGETVTVKATVKAHEDYKGTKQTVLTRVAVQ